jgi:hypothetical protein
MTSAMPVRTLVSSATSSSTSSTWVPAAAAMAWSFSAEAMRRTVPNTRKPFDARWTAMARPIPELAPVTTATARSSTGWSS